MTLKEVKEQTTSLYDALRVVDKAEYDMYISCIHIERKDSFDTAFYNVTIRGELVD